jgi:hypothetical protein
MKETNRLAAWLGADVFGRIRQFVFRMRAALGAVIDNDIVVCGVNAGFGGEALRV